MAYGRACIFGASGGIGKALCERIAAANPDWTVHAGSRNKTDFAAPNVNPFRFDLEDEASIVDAARNIESKGPLDLVIVATGVLQTDDFSPEKTWRALDALTMAKVFAINTIGPALIAKHMIPLLRKDGRPVFAAICARVGSIEDNRLGGWHSYRASKAALIMLIRNFAIELKRQNKGAAAVALHPGTVDTDLSQPFQRNVAPDKLFTPQYSAERLLSVIGSLTSDDSGRHLAWDGQPMPA